MICLFFSQGACRLHKGSRSHVHVCPRPCLSTCRWAQLATRRQRGPHSVRSPCSHAHVGRATTACVSSPRGCPRWLAHVARHGYLFGASASMRTVSFAFDRSHQKPQSQNWRQFSVRRACPRCVLQCVFNAPPGARQIMLTSSHEGESKTTTHGRVRRIRAEVGNLNQAPRLHGTNSYCRNLSNTTLAGRMSSPRYLVRT